MADALLRVAAVLAAFIALTFGPGAVYTMTKVAAGQDKPVLFGIRAFGGGAFDGYSRQPTLALLGGFVALCVVDLAAAWLLWGGHRGGAILGLATVPIGAVFWWGFSLPVPPMFAAVRSLLIVLRWKEPG